MASGDLVTCGVAEAADVGVVTPGVRGNCDRLFLVRSLWFEAQLIVGSLTVWPSSKKDETQFHYQ